MTHEHPPPIPDGAPPPPWGASRRRAWAQVVPAEVSDDGRRWGLWWPAMTDADAQAASLGDLAELLGVNLRRLHDARGWLRDHAPAHYASLRHRPEGLHTGD